MSSTNKTANYELSQFIGSDKPAWLIDYNGDMSKIDTAIHNIAVAQGGEASDVTVLQGKVSDLETLTASHTSEISGLDTDVTHVQADITSINSLIGNGTPTTTDKTIIGAINELNSEIGGTVSAGDVTYDNTTSGLTADDVQEAIDELAQAVPSVASEVQSGTLTAGQTSITLTFASQTIGSTSRITVFNDLDVAYSSIATTSTTVTLTFEAQASDMSVSVEVDN